MDKFYRYEFTTHGKMGPAKRFVTVETDNSFAGRSKAREMLATMYGPAEAQDARIDDWEAVEPTDPRQ